MILFLKKLSKENEIMKSIPVIKSSSNKDNPKKDKAKMC